MRVFKASAWLIANVVILALGVEIFARVALGYKPLLYSTSYDPIFVSGDFVGGKSRAELKSATNAPAAYGYEATAFGQYFWNGEVAPNSLTSLSDFLFAHYLSRYSSRDVDDIVCQQPDALAIYVLGGSVAVGSSATSKLTSWHALLERSLRENSRRGDIYLFNAAMSGFISTQERLAYHLAVFPRAADVVLIVNGANDLFGPASSAVRPGDPSQLATRYNQFYGNRLIVFLAERSALLNRMFQAVLTRSVLTFRQRLANEDDFFERYANSAVNSYIENMSAIIKDCQANGTVCLVAIQAVRSLSASYVGSPAHGAFVLPPDRVRQLYDLLFKRLADSRYSQHFLDLTHLIKTDAELAYYTDSVHLDDRGQKLLANALLPPVESAIKQVKGKRVKEAIIPCGRIPAKDRAVIDLARVASLNGGEVLRANDAVRVIADARQWAYSAALIIGGNEDLSRPDTAIRVRLSVLVGEIGLGLVTDLDAKELVHERHVAAEAGDVEIDLPVPRGAKQVVLIFRKHALDGQRSEISIRKIAVQAR